MMPRQKFITPATWDQWNRQCRGKAKHKTEKFAEEHRLYREKHEGGAFQQVQMPVLWQLARRTRQPGSRKGCKCFINKAIKAQNTTFFSPLTGRM